MIVSRDCSLPFYMSHVPVIVFLIWREKPADRVWAAPVAYLLTILLAWLLTHYYEKVRPRALRKSRPT